MGLLSGFSAALAFSSVVSAGLPPITVVGTKLFDSNGKQFYVKGVAYQQESTNSSQVIADPLSDPTSCKRDAPLMQKIGINTIRTYAIDPTLDHKECMAEFESAGIYILSDLSQPRLSINREDPEWNTDLFDHYTSVVDSLASYSNVIGFFAGNEVSNNVTNSAASAFVKAAVRDTKAYIAQKGYKNVFVGYAANDDPLIRQPLGEYFACGSEAERADIFGYNIYSWCGESDMQKSGYDKRAEEFQNYPIPVIFSEIGCNLVDGSRPFTEIEAIYSDQMTPFLSGSIVYMWFQEENDYGLVVVKDGQATVRQDYTNLGKELAKVHPTQVEKSSYKPSSDLLACPSDATAWPVSSNLPPSPNKDLCSCMTASLSCVVADNVKSEDYGAIFAQACGTASCDGIHANSTSGEYGAYSMCQSKEKLSFALNQYYKKQNYASTACDFNGQAKIQSPSKSGGSCKTLLSKAGSDGTGTVSSGGSGSASGSDSKNPDKKGAGVALSFNTIKAAFVTAGAFGLGMLLVN